MASQIELTPVDKEKRAQSRKSSKVGRGLLDDPTNLQQSSKLDSSSTTKRNSRKSRKHSRRSETSLASKAAAQARDELEEISSTMRAGHTIPLKDALKSLYRVNRYKVFIGVFTWSVFVFLTFNILQMVRDTEVVFQQESALDDLFMDEEFKGSSFKKNFDDIMTVEELYQWLEGPMLEGVYPDTYYNGRMKGKDDTGYILDVMKLVGGIRIRQHRVSKNSCKSRRFIKEKDVAKFDNCKRTVLNATCEKDDDYCGINICSCTDGDLKYEICPFDRMDQSCYNDYYTDTGGLTWDFLSVSCKTLIGFGTCDDRSHGTIGGELFYPKFMKSKNEKDLRNNNMKQPNRYTLKQLNSTLYTARHGVGKMSGNFGTMGYIEDLPATNQTQAAAILKEMKQEMWIDVQTRAVAVTFQVYNTMTRYVTVLRFTFEINASGRIFKRGQFFTFPLILYGQSGNATFRLFLEIIMCCFVFFFVQKEIRKIIRQGPKHYCCKRKSTAIEVISLTYYIIFLVSYYSVHMRIEHIALKFHVLNPYYTDIYDIAVEYQYSIYLGGFWFLVASVKFLKYLSISKTAMLLLKTVVAAKSLLLSFLTTMGGLMGLFAVTAHFLYGGRIEDFHSVPMSLLQMIRWMIGDVDYDELHEIRPAFTPWVYVSFQLLFFFLALNMLIAIVINQFDVVQKKALLESKWKREVSGFGEDIHIRWVTNTLRFRAQCYPWICCCCLNRKHGSKILKLMEMSRMEANNFVRKQCKNKQQSADVGEEWKNAHAAVIHYWKCKAILLFQHEIRRLQRFGKKKSTGSGVNLYTYLEELYNHWERRAVEGAIDGSFAIEDSRLPIAVISANRLAFFVCKTESFDAVNESSTLFSDGLQTKMVVDAQDPTRATIISAHQQLSSLRNSNFICRKILNYCKCGTATLAPVTKKSKSQRHSELIQVGIDLAERTVNACYSISEHIVVGPLNDDVNEWTNATAIQGEKLRLTMSRDEIRGCLYQCAVSTDMLGGVNCCTYSNSGCCVPRVKAVVRHIFVDETSAQLYILEKCNINTRQQHYKATGPIRIIVDLFYLQQIHVDQIDERVLLLMLDDNVGRSFRLQFKSKKRRDTCIDLIVHSCRLFQGGEYTQDEDERFVVCSGSDEDESESEEEDEDETSDKVGGDEGGGKEKTSRSLVEVGRAVQAAVRVNNTGTGNTGTGRGSQGVKKKIDRHNGGKKKKKKGNRGSTIMMPGQERPTFVRTSAGMQLDAKSKSPGKSKSKSPGRSKSPTDFPQKLNTITTVGKQKAIVKRGSNLNRMVIAKRGSRRIRERRMSVSQHNASDLRGVNI